MKMDWSVRSLPLLHFIVFTVPTTVEGDLPSVPIEDRLSNTPWQMQHNEFDNPSMHLDYALWFGQPYSDPSALESPGEQAHKSILEGAKKALIFLAHRAATSCEGTWGCTLVGYFRLFHEGGNRQLPGTHDSISMHVKCLAPFS